MSQTAITGKDCGIPAGHYLAKRKGWNIRAEMYCDGVNWFFADHCLGDLDTPRLILIRDGIELIYIEANDWQPVRFSRFKEEVTFNQINWWDANFKDQSEQFKGEYADVDIAKKEQHRLICMHHKLLEKASEK